MIARKLIDLIESKSAGLAHGLLSTFRSSEKMADLRRVPAQELEARAFEVYRNLSEWLLHRTEGEIEKRYHEIGRRRAQQGVALSHLLWALIAVKRHLWDFLNREITTDQMLELQQEMELIRMVDRFFDLTLYYAAQGYEREWALQIAVREHNVVAER